MPEMGRAHKLLSGRHPDTQAPAAGADPDDGQVATWSAALEAWIAADPAAGGVTDHGLLTGLGDDDHPHYALADKSSPSPWVAAADLAARSIADLGTKAHDLLDGLGDDDHAQYALADKSRPTTWVAAADLAGRSLADLGTKDHDLLGGLGDNDHPQYARLAVNENVTGLWQFSNVGRLNMAGDLDVAKHMAVGGAASPLANAILYAYEVDPTTLDPIGNLLYMRSSFQWGRYIRGIMGYAEFLGSGSLASIRGLDFNVANSGTGASIANMYAARVSLSYFGVAVPAFAKGVEITAGGAGARPLTAHGVHIGDMLAATMGYGLKIDDQSGTTAYLLEAGPATPNLRLLAGTPGAGDTALLLSVGGTLYRLVREADGSAAFVGV